MRTLGISAIAAGMMLASVSAASAYSPNTCAMIADMGYTAAQLRSQGYEPQEAADDASHAFSVYINSPQAMKELTNEERRSFAGAWANMAEQVIQTVYSLPSKRAADHGKVAEALYVICRSEGA